MSVTRSPVLPDVLARGLDVVFCGTAVGDSSAKRRAYYAGRGNQFWAVLARVGLTSRQLEPAEFEDLLSYGIGLTDLAKHVHGADSEVAREAFDARALRQRVE